MKRKLDKKLISDIFTLAWPTMLEEAMGTAVQYIDTAMVGAVGTFATAAIGSTATFSWLIGGMVSAFGVGFLSYISRAIGAGKKELVKKASAQAVTVTLLVGSIFTLVTVLISSRVPVWMHVDEIIRELSSKYFLIIYLPMLFRSAIIIFGAVLRSAGDTKTPMKIGVFVNVLNTVLNYFFIFPVHEVSVFGLSFKVFGFGLGVIGAAIASASSFVIGGILETIALFRHPKVSPLGEKLSPDKNILFPCLRVAVPNMFQRFCASLGYVVFASMINALGEVTTAAHTVANTVESAFYIPGYGMSTAAATLTGNCIGARDEERRKGISYMLLVIELFMMTLSGGLLFIFAPGLVHIFSKDPAVMVLSITVLRMVAVSEPFYGVSIIIEGMLLGAGETKRPFVINILGMWVVRIFGTFVCTRFLSMGLISAWSCMIAGNMVIMLLYVLYYSKGSWNPIMKEIKGE